MPLTEGIYLIFKKFLDALFSADLIVFICSGLYKARHV